MKAVLTFGPQLEPIFLDEDSRIMEMMSSDFFKNNGRPVPQTVQKLGAGFGNLSGQAFGESQNACGPQGEVLRFNDNHDEKTGQFTGSGSSDKESQWKSSGTNVSGDMKTTTYTGKNQTIVVEHNTKENKITIKHLDSSGNLLVQQTHDSVGAARKELTTQGIDHKFYALRSEQRFALEPERDNSGKYSMGTVAKFEHEDGRIAFVTKHNGKFHVNVLKNGVPYLPAATYDDKEVATAKAAELLRFNENHDEKGQFSSGDSSAKDEASSWHSKDGDRKFPTDSRVIDSSPFKSGPREDYRDFKRSAFEAVKDAPVQEVKVDTLVTGQPVLDADRLRPFDKSSAPPIEVIRYKGNDWIVQGNHRAASAWVASEPTISAHVLNLDEAKNAQYHRAFDPDQPRDKDGSFSMGNVAKFEHEDGRVSYVTKFNGKFHVNVLKNGQPYLPSAMYSDKEVATAKAEGLLKREGERRVPEGWHVYDASGKEMRWF